eukprot:TRINITY_DN14249_c0_g1_i1.p1 TRINITY_DN14249_c0_g1~~TRINITY_DN14249_c0_g1_i1.p1  ORF type:complete len:276 (+),score=70.84 TRINITY_DN14249_c0_g1_i1:79-828(+)
MCPAAGAVRGLCEVRSSCQPGGGQGVFLLRGVPAGTVVTLFAGRVREEGEHLRLRRAGDPLASYTLSLGGGQVLIPPAPEQWADGEMGHKVNDAAAVLLPSNLRGLSDRALADCLAAGFASYVSTLGATPCEFAPASDAAKDPAIGDRHLIAVVAKRPMEAGAEVLASYGLGYWVHRCVGELFWRQQRFEAARTVWEEAAELARAARSRGVHERLVCVQEPPTEQAWRRLMLAVRVLQGASAVFRAAKL